MKVIYLLPLVFLIGLSACALSPQQVELTPTITPVNQDHVGHNQPLRVVGKDWRDSQVIGSRGGVYADSSLIRASNNVADVLASKVRRNLQGRGFNTLNADGESAVLSVGLVALHYAPAKGTIVNRVVVDTTLKAVLATADGQYTRTYTSSITFEQPLTPSADKNQDMLNQVLSRALNKLLNDPLLLKRLQALPQAGRSPSPTNDTDSSSKGVALPIKPGVQSLVLPEPSDSQH